MKDAEAKLWARHGQMRARHVQMWAAQENVGNTRDECGQVAGGFCVHQHSTSGMWHRS